MSDSDKLRPLPTWMAKKEDKKATEKETLGESRKRRRLAGTIYCMNEKELVEAAIAYLVTNDKCEDGDSRMDLQVKDKARKGRKKPSTKRTARDSTSAGHSTDVQDTTCVSETDIDLTEAETLPYTNTSSCPERRQPEGHSLSALQDQIDPVNPGLEADRAEEHTHTSPSPTAEEDDALQLVREIFFT